MLYMGVEQSVVGPDNAISWAFALAAVGCGLKSWLQHTKVVNN